MSPHKPHYSLIIEWSDEDQKYIVSFPPWGDGTHTRGATYEVVARNDHEALADLVDLWREQGRPLPQPRAFAASATSG
jgi:antitoxin HicB